MTSKPRVLVGIPTLNGSDRLWRCLSSIAAHTDFSRFDVKVFVADDHSSPAEQLANQRVIERHREFWSKHRCGDVELLPSIGRKGIAATWNRLVRHDETKRTFIVLINDDIEVVDDWLEPLVFTLAENPIVGMVGLNSYPGTIESAIEAKPLRVDYAEARIQDGGGSLVSAHGPIFAFRREDHEKVGGFDERYFVFYEEVDFGVTLRRRGFMSTMLSYPIVYHMGGATNSNPENLNAYKTLEESRQKFVAKWGKTVDQLRREFVDTYTLTPFFYREWNSQWKVWRDE